MMEYSFPEQLLLGVLSKCIDQDKRIDLNEIKEVDWRELVNLAKEQEVAPLLYHCLFQKVDNIKLPDNLQQNLRQIYVNTLHHNMQLFREVEYILKTLKMTGIPVIPLKGVYLAEKVYGNIGLRPMSDVDLLVQRSHLVPAVKVMEKMGYKADRHFDVEQEIRISHHLPSFTKPGAASVEIHWNLVPSTTPFIIPIEQIWKSANKCILEGVEILEMAPEDLLLHLCVHAAYLEYFSSRLRPFCDIAWTIHLNTEKMDWNRFVLQARKWGAERSIYLALRVTQQLFGVTIPKKYLERLQPPGYDINFERWAIMQILEPVEIGGKLAEVLAPQSLLSRIGGMVKNLFPPPWEMKAVYPVLASGFKWPVAYLKHLGNVFQRNFQVIWKLLRKEPAVMRKIDQRDKVNQLIKWQSGKE